jgi:hypothetical protein
VIENTYQEDVLPMTFGGTVMLKNTHQENVLTMTHKEKVVIKDYKQYTMSTKHETTNKEDDKTYRKNDVVPTTVANTSSGYDDPDDPHQNKVIDETGPRMTPRGLPSPQWRHLTLNSEIPGLNSSITSLTF